MVFTMEKTWELKGGMEQEVFSKNPLFGGDLCGSVRADILTRQFFLLLTLSCGHGSFNMQIYME